MSSASPTPGPAHAPSSYTAADALYTWCRDTHDFGYVFTQTQLLDSGQIPNGDLETLLKCTTYLVAKHLFRVHDVRATGAIGWELVSAEKAANYANLTRDESLVYSCIDSSGTAGIWTKTIKARLQAHAKVLDRVYKSLEGKALIKPMKSVKNPQRKMYILSGLQPSEEATGGAWYTEGRLDSSLIEIISDVTEHFVSGMSWREIDRDTGKDVTGRDNKKQHRHGKIVYDPFPAGHTKYPTMPQITKHVADSKVAPGQSLPEEAIMQLLDVMLFDDRLFRMTRPVQIGEEADTDVDSDAPKITMYRCFETQASLRAQQRHKEQLQSHDKHLAMKARRQQELEDIGRGGASEIPCMRCPRFDDCEDGGPINARTCVYFEEWYGRLDAADLESGRLAPKIKMEDQIMQKEDIKGKGKAKDSDITIHDDDDDDDDHTMVDA